MMNRKFYTVWINTEGTIYTLMRNMEEVYRGTKEEVKAYMEKNNITVKKGY